MLLMVLVVCPSVCVSHRATHTRRVIKIHLIAATDTHWTSSVSVRVSASYFVIMGIYWNREH